MKITHIKGTHFSLPFSIKCSSKQTIEWTVDFTDATYDVGMPDQYDWNKLCGIKWNYFQPRKDALMVGWRYINNRYELCLYVHRNSSFSPPAEPLFVTDKLAKITLSLNKLQKTVTLSIAGNLVFAFETGESFTLNEISLNQLIFKKMRNPKNEALEAEEQEAGY